MSTPTQESTRRALRTALQLLLALPVLVPGIVAELKFLPANLYTHVTAISASVVAVGSAATKVYLSLEAKGLLPSWLHISVAAVPKPVQTDNSPRPEDGDQSAVSQDPNVSYEGDATEVTS